MARNRRRRSRRARVVPVRGRSQIPANERGREKGFARQQFSRKPFGAWRDWIVEERPVWRFTALLFAGLVLFYTGYALFFASRYSEGLLRLIASVSAAALSALGHEARADGAMVTAPAFAFQVVRGCDGLEPVGFLLAAAVATRARRWTRCLFALIGGVILVALNLVRLVTLALVDAHFPRLAEVMHWNAWPAMIIVVVVLLWVSWTRRVELTDWKSNSS